MTQLGNFLRGQSVFLTGHTGFKGSWLSLWLAAMGANVHGYALRPALPSLFEEAHVVDCLATHTIGDIRDHECLQRALQSARPTIVFHMAAQALVRPSYQLPRETYEINVMGTVNLLETVRHSECVRVCQVITSDKCYENCEQNYGYRETDPMGGSDPYSSSKGCAELVASAYRRSFFNPADIQRHGVSLATVRAGNVIGGGDWAEDRIVPDCIRALQHSEPIVVRNPSAVRPWQHVLEPLAGYLTLAQHQLQKPAQFAEPFNFGPSTAGNLTVRELVEMVLTAWGSGTWTTPQPTSAKPAHEAGLLQLDISKATTLLGWRPAFSVDQAVAQAVAWYRHRATEGVNFKAREPCLAQIDAYPRIGA